MQVVNLSGTTIPHESLGAVGGARVFLKPASAGTGVIAAGGVRAVLEVAGVRDILTKSMGSANVLNVVMATFDALQPPALCPAGGRPPRQEGRRVAAVLGAEEAACLRSSAGGQKLRVTLVKSPIGFTKDQKATVRGPRPASHASDR